MPPTDGRVNLFVADSALLSAMDECSENLPDERLAERIRDGDSQAFVVLLRRYERSLAALIGRRLGATGTVDAVEDLLQETFVQAWTGLGSLSPRDVRTWLYQVARNRCSDYLRSPQRRERFVDDDALATMVNRVGAVDARWRRAAASVVEAFDAVPERERQALVSFYVDGLSIAEIAARHRVPAGTIKRRLSHGRDRVRGEMGIAVERRRKGMTTDSRAELGPFPKVRPDIVVERLGVKASPVDMRELTWWFVIPDLDDEVRWAEYQPTRMGTEWRLTRSTAMRTARPAVIHDRDCVEIEVGEESYPVDGLLDPPRAGRHTKVWGLLSETDVEWVAVEQTASDGTRRLDTFLDDGFEQDWGACARRIEAGDGWSRSRVAASVAGAGPLRCSRTASTPCRSANGHSLVLGSWRWRRKPPSWTLSSWRMSMQMGERSSSAATTAIDG